MDLLNVVIRADTSGSDKAEASLEQMTAAARGADAAVNSLGRSCSSAGAGIGAVASASEKAAASAKMYAAALATQAQAARVAGAANDNLRLNTANIAAQFQDIGVTAAMGMNPLMIALQQGTQLSAVFSAQSGGVLKTLAAAFASVLSPISLVTIAVVGLAAAGLQMVDWGSTAEVVLNGIANVLVPIAPYAAAAAAGLALLYAPAIIMGIVSLVAALGSLAAQAITTAATMAMANPGGALILGLAAAATAAVIFREDLARIFGRDIVADAQQGINWIIGAFVGGFNGIKATWSMLPAAIGDLVIQSVNNTIGGVESMLQFITSKINEFIRNINGAISLIPENMRGGWSGIGEIGDVSFGRVANPNAGAANAVSGVIGSEMSAAMGQDYVGELVSMVQKGASGAADALRGLATAAGAAGSEADKAGKAAAKEAERLLEAYTKIVAGAEEFIAKQENERQAMGMSEQEASALRHSFELLNKAREAGIELTPEQVSELNGLGREMAAAETETKRLTKAFDDQKKMVDDVLGTIGGAFSGLFDGTIKDFDGFIDHMVEGFAKLGQGNLDKLFSAEGLGAIFNGNPQAANDNAGGSTNIFDAIFQGAKAGTEEGSATGLFAGIKGLQGLSGMAGAGLGGFGIGAQTQNPIMGALGGALSGFAVGGPVGAVIGGIGGIVGALFGMNKALKEAREKLKQVRPAIEQFMDSMNGEVVSQYAKALADAKRQAQEYIDLAKKAKDTNLVKEIEAALANLPATLARQYEKDLQASVNNLEGNRYLNEIAAAQELYNARLKDAAELGADGSLALTELGLSLRKIAEEADLSQSELNRLATLFPELAAMLSDALVGSTAKALADAQLILSGTQQNVERARADLRQAFDAERGVLEQTIARHRQFIRSLQDFKDSLKLDSNLSPLNPQQRFEEAQSQFQDTVAKAFAGDEEAMAELESVSRQYLEEARAYYGSSEAYFAVFNAVEATLDQALVKAQQQVSVADQQLSTLNAQVGKLIDIDNGILGVSAAIGALASAVIQMDRAQADYDRISGNGSMAGVTRLYRDVLGRDPDAAGAVWWQKFMGSGGLTDNLYAQFAAAARNRGEATLPGYANGTDFHPGGMAWVGERGRELVNLPRGSQVIPHQRSMAMAGGNDNETVKELRELNRSLSARLASLEAVVASGEQANVAATDRSTAATREQSSMIKRGSDSRVA
ncbi:MAG TPA: phage tail length tape measure family protein [Ramlibacter sp.]|jgi:gas vesicle protein